MNARTAAANRRALAFLSFVALVQTLQAAPSGAPPAPEIPATQIGTTGLPPDPGPLPWPTEDRRAFADLLAGQRFEYLIAPTQVQKEGFDRAERSMISAMLGQALARAGTNVPNTYVVNRALGEAKRRLPLQDIETLAQVVHATIIVVPYVGHNDASELTLTLAVYRKPNASLTMFNVRPEFFTWDGAKYSAEFPPTTVIQSLIPEILQRLHISGGTSSRPAPPFHTLELPSSPEKLATVSDGTDPLENAARFAVLGAIAPPWSRGAERLYEKCLLASQDAPASSEQAFLHAYALFHVGLRPAAVTALHRYKSHEISALNAILNGNYSGTEALIQQTSGYKRLILELELRDLARQYELDAQKPLPPLLLSLAKRSTDWNSLLQIRWDFHEAWADQSNVPLKQLLDQWFPLPGQSLPELAAAHRATPGQELTWVDLQLSAREHIRAYMLHERPSLCCTEVSQRPDSLDTLSLIDAWSDSRTMWSISAELRFRGMPERAHTMVADLDRFYSGYPLFDVVRAEVDNSIAGRLPVSERGTYLSDARERTQRAIVAAGGQTSPAISAISIMNGDQSTRLLARAYSRDYPLNPYWLSNDFVIDQNERPALAREALANTQTGVGYISLIILDGGDGVRAESAKALHDRFLGNPQREKVQEAITPPPTSTVATLARLQAAVRERPDNWEPRRQLGGFLVLQGDYAGALQAYANFPGFSAKVPVQPIGLSNFAGEAGDFLFGHGATREARHMLQIATRYQVGSEAEMTSVIELRLLDGDLQGALEEAHQRAERYPGGASYGDYMSLLHVLGRSSEAWQAFNLLIEHSLGPEPWESAMVGLRMRGTTQSDLDKWLASPEIAHVNTRAVPWAAGFLLIWASTDRDVSDDLAERTHSLGYEPRGLIEGVGLTSYPASQNEGRILITRSAFRSDQRPILRNQTPVASDSYFFAQALVALEKRDFSTAVSRFDAIATYQPIEKYLTEGDATYTLPEFAYASAMVGDPLKLEAYVASLPDNAQPFEVYLARAYFQALGHHDTPKALQSLHRAQLLIDRIVGRPPSMEYQYSNAAERMFRETGDARFQSIAITWARTCQTLQPWSAWPYTMEAELSPDATRRESALAKALFLDPLSPRLKAIPADEVQRARAALSKGNPFVLQSPRPSSTLDRTAALPSSATRH